MISAIIQRYRAEKRRQLQRALLNRLLDRYHTEIYQRLAVARCFERAGFMVAARLARRQYRQRLSAEIYQRQLEFSVTEVRAFS